VPSTYYWNLKKKKKTMAVLRPCIALRNRLLGELGIMLYALAQKALIPVNPNPFRLYLIQTFFLNLKTIPME
jgi:hypothetical protein